MDQHRLWIVMLLLMGLNFLLSYQAGFQASTRSSSSESASPKNFSNLSKKKDAGNESSSSSTPAPATGHHGDTEFLWNGRELYHEAAKALKPVTDKVTTHTYQIMYGRFLLPYYYHKPSMKMLEIGLGCDMGYGPGASVALYKKLFPQAELWEAEYDVGCVEKHRNGTLKGVHVVTGDQGNDNVLDGWIETTGGNFDVIIDDGGHQNCQIWHSFKKLWGTIKSGGLYFIEDMQVARSNGYRKAHTKTCDQNLIVPERLKGFVDDLIYDTSRKSDIEFIFCQSEACVLGKK